MNEIRTHDLCDAGAVLYQLKYETCIRHADERLYRREDSRSYLRNQTVAKNPEKKKKNPGLK